MTKEYEKTAPQGLATAHVRNGLFLDFAPGANHALGALRPEIAPVLLFAAGLKRLDQSLIGIRRFGEFDKFVR